MSAILEGNNSTIEGQLGFKGETGDSAYEIAVKHGYTGTEAEWADSFLNADNYYDKSEIDATLEGYDTSAEVDEKLNAKITNSYSTSTTNTYSCDYLNPNIATGYLTNNYTVSSTHVYEKLPITSFSTLGTKLSINNGDIVIGEGVHHVKISGNVSYRTSVATESKYVTVNIGSDVAIRINQNVPDGTNGNFSLPSVIKGVSQGDKLSLQVYGTSTESINGANGLLITYLTVEVID